MFKPIESDWSLTPALKPITASSGFYAEFSRHIRKVVTADIPTACIAYDRHYDEFVMAFNPEFMAKHTFAEQSGIVLHEFHHGIFGHIIDRTPDISGKDRSKMMLWNWSTDLAINSLIKTNRGTSGSGADLPSTGLLIPGTRPTYSVSDGAAKKVVPVDNKIAELIEKAPPLMSSEWYYNYLRPEWEKMEEAAQKIAEELIKSLDDHDHWGNGGEEGEGEGSDAACGDSEGVPNDLIREKMRQLLEKSMKAADRSNSWGNMSQEMRDLIRELCRSVIDWKKILRQFVGHISPGSRSSSFKRLNRRYPYIAPGLKRGRVPKILIAVDQSGSVSDEDLMMFSGEIWGVTKLGTVDVINFDTTVDVSSLKTLKKGQGIRGKLERTRCGGTDFQPISDFVNDPKNRGRWDGIIIATDGYAPAPTASRLRRAWLITKGGTTDPCKSDVIINMADEKKPGPGW